MVQEFFDVHLKPFFLDMTIYDAFANQHPITRLGKRLDNDLGCRDHRIATHTTKAELSHELDRVVAMLMIHDKVHFYGVAVSGRYAKKKLAEIALNALDGLPEYEYRRRYGCNCSEAVPDVAELKLS